MSDERESALLWALILILLLAYVAVLLFVRLGWGP